MIVQGSIKHIKAQCVTAARHSCFVYIEIYWTEVVYFHSEIYSLRIWQSVAATGFTRVSSEAVKSEFVFVTSKQGLIYDCPSVSSCVSLCFPVSMSPVCLWAWCLCGAPSLATPAIYQLITFPLRQPRLPFRLSWYSHVSGLSSFVNDPSCLHVCGLSVTVFFPCV